MNEAKLHLAVPRSLEALHIGGMLALTSAKSAQRTREQTLAPNVGQLLRGIGEIVDGLVVTAISKTTGEEFREACDDLLQKYLSAVRAFTDLTRIAVPKNTMDALTNESICEEEAEIREHGLSAFGSDVRDQAIFTLWSLRKIHDLCERIDSVLLVEEHLEPDREMYEKFVWHAVSARFHLDCLLKAIQLKKRIYPEVLEIIVDGLRNVVNAYSWARQALDLRAPLPEPTMKPVIWDEEDQALLEETNREAVDEELIW